MNENESLSETLKTVFYAIVIALFIRTFLFEPFKIPSGSMYPTLYVGDYLFVSKYSYGYSKHSLPYSLPLIDNRVMSEEPEVGDVVVFKLPTDNKTDYIKRVIGKAGDKIQMIGGVLHINGVAVEREQVEDFVFRDRFGNTTRYNQYIETLPNGKKHRILEISDYNEYDDTIEFTVPNNQLFMMGDNRDASDDSRVHVGFVPMENLVGKARMLFYSFDSNDGKWYFPWTWPKGIRWERIFDKIV